MFPMCWGAYTVGPHEYMPTWGWLAGANSATSLANVLNSRVAEQDATAPHHTSVTARPRNTVYSWR